MYNQNQVKGLLASLAAAQATQRLLEALLLQMNPDQDQFAGYLNPDIRELELRCQEARYLVYGLAGTLSEATRKLFVVYAMEDEADDGSRFHGHPEIFGVSQIVANHNRRGDSFVVSDRGDSVIVHPHRIFSTRQGSYEIPVDHCVETPYIESVAVFSSEQAGIDWSISTCKEEPKRPLYSH